MVQFSTLIVVLWTGSLWWLGDDGFIVIWGRFGRWCCVVGSVEINFPRIAYVFQMVYESYAILIQRFIYNFVECVIKCVNFVCVQVNKNKGN